MTKKLINIYDYQDYRVLLNDDFMARTHLRHSYSLRAYSRDLCLSPGFLSDLLRGKKELSPSTGREIFTHLGLDADELNYVENLIVLRTSDDKWKKSEAYDYVQKRFHQPPFKEDQSKDLFLQSREHFLIYGLVRRVPEIDKIQFYTKQLDISVEQTQKVISSFIEAGYFIEGENGLTVADDKVVIKNHQDVLQRVVDFSELIGSTIKKNGGVKPPEQVAHALILGLDRQSFDLAHEAHKHFIKSLHRIADQSTKVDRFVFVSDLFLAIEQRENSPRPTLLKASDQVEGTACSEPF